jgi:hypothetical protein
VEDRHSLRRDVEPLGAKYCDGLFCRELTHPVIVTLLPMPHVDDSPQSLTLHGLRAV